MLIVSFPDVEEGHLVFTGYGPLGTSCALVFSQVLQTLCPYILSHLSCGPLSKSHPFLLSSQTIV
jgi:hypothetical protein